MTWEQGREVSSHISVWLGYLVRISCPRFLLTEGCVRACPQLLDLSQGLTVWRFLKFVLTNKLTVCCVSLCVFQWVDHPGRLLISTSRHGDPGADRAEEEEDRGGNGWVSVAPLSASLLTIGSYGLSLKKKKKKKINKKTKSEKCTS